MPPKLITCRKCKRELPRSEFAKQVGQQPVCNRCFVKHPKEKPEPLYGDEWVDKIMSGLGPGDY
jgi:hypothetical protein